MSGHSRQPGLMGASAALTLRTVARVLNTGSGLRTAARLLLAMALVGAASWYGISGVSRAEDQHHVHHAAAGVRAELNHLAALENGAEAGEPAPDEEVDAALVALHSRLDRALANLSTEATAEVRRDVNSYAAAAELTVQAYNRGDEEAGDELDDEETDPLFDELLVTFREIERHADMAAGDASDAAVRGLVGATVLALGSILVLGALEARARWRALERRTHGRMLERQRALVEHSPVQTYVIDEAGRVEFASAAAEKALGRVATDLAGLLDVVAPGHKEQFGESLVDGTIEFDAPHVIQAGGAGMWFEVTVSDQRDNPVIVGLVVSVRDITERVDLEERLRRQASEDVLTGLPNRRGLHASISAALARADRRDTATALLLIDLDGFKGVNDTLGHPVGDALLVEVAGRLSVSTRSGEVIARLGGDEFALVIEAVDHDLAIEQAAARLLDAVRVPFEVEGQLLSVNASIGVAIGSGDTDVDTLFRYADIALYEAKHAGGGCWRTFAPEMEDLMLVQTRLQREMEPAFQRGEFTLAYQPLIAVADRHPTGFEALMRWHSPALGQVTPANFIPAAERSGLIVSLGRWALLESTRQLVVWQQEFADPTLTMSVNASVVELAEDGFVEHLAAVLAETGVDPATLQIEVTESVLVDDESSVVERLEAIRSMGVRVAMDDFGTGYSSMSQLRALPVDCLKIDRGFIAAMGDDDRASSVVNALIELGRALGLMVVAEGVETEARSPQRPPV